MIESGNVSSLARAADARGAKRRGRRRGKQVLVTGGAGFLGSHLCERLATRGDHVICLDNLSTGDAQNLRLFEAAEGFRFVLDDVAKPFDFKVDQIFNLACPASPVDYQADPIGALKTSVLGAINALDLAARAGARVLQASTSEIYGDPEIHPQREDYWGNVNSFGPRACYDEGKRAAETLFHDYRDRRGVEIRVARIFNTYGPRMQFDDGRVVSNFITQALTDKPITIYGDGQQTRSFCYVDDLIDGLVRLMDSPDAPQTPVNLGNPVEITIGALAETIIELAGSASRIEYRPLPVDDPRRRRPDIGLARRTLDWEPKTPLIEGLRRTIDYFDAALGRRRELQAVVAI